MNKSILIFAAVAALALSTSGHAAKPDTTCRPTLPQPTGLIVESDGTTITSTWNEIESESNEAAKYALEITAHYAEHTDVTFAFTAFDNDPGVLNTDTFAIAAVGLDTTVCDDLACSTSTTHHAVSVTVKVKGLNPPKKGKESSQCNPFSAPVSADVAPGCPCFDAAFLAQVAVGAEGPYVECAANYQSSPGTSIQWRARGIFEPTLSADAYDNTPYGGSLTCVHYENTDDFAPGLSFSAENLTNTQFSACTALIEAAQSTVGCQTCSGDNCQN